MGEIGKRQRRRWLILALALVAAPLLAELGLRYLLFGESRLAQSLGKDLRRAGLYADPLDHESFWKLRHRFQSARPGFDDAPSVFDPHLGWRTKWIAPETFEHQHRKLLAGRRPVLLYGASFAGPNYTRLLQRSDLSKDHLLLCYGVGGFGFDQVYLLLQASLDHYRGLDPIVVIAPVVNGDFDRCSIAFRSWPKPRFTLDESGALVRTEPTVVDTRTYLERNPLRIRSYLWSHLVHGESFLPDSWTDRLSGTDERRREKQELIRALVQATKAEVDARGFTSFYLLFNSRADVEAGGNGWQEGFVTQLLAEEGLPYLVSRPALQRAIEEDGETLDDLFLPMTDERAGHLTERGEEVAFTCLLRGIQGDFDGP